jgi:tetratricopeptide (TPR) repeat protein
LLNEAPTDIGLQMQMGAIYKTIAQVFQEIGNTEQTDKYIERAEHIFEFIKDNVPSDQKTALDIANAIHGLGNMYHMSGVLEKAIENYKLTSTLYPNHRYTWHDMFLAYNELAKQRKADLDAMRRALDMVKKTGLGQPGLSAKHIAGLEAIYDDLERTMKP